MSYLKIIRRIVKDNGLFKGAFMFLMLSSQKFLKYPKSHIYSYNSKKINKIAKIKYSTDISKGFALFEIFGFCPYYSSESGKIKFRLNHQSKVCDIGAFIGDSAVFFGLQGAKVYSYEPQETAFKLINENLKLNGLKNVKILNYPVTSDGRMLSLNNNSDKISDGFNITDNFGNNKIKSVKFEDALTYEKKWDLVKIDIEGGEWEILRSICKKPDILKSINGIAMEIHHPLKNKETLDKFSELLKSENFAVEINAQNALGMLWAKRNN